MRHLLSRSRPATAVRPTRSAPWPTCASIARCAPTNARRTSTFPKLMLEAKAANVAEHGLDRTDWALARTESFARWAAPSPRWPTPCWRAGLPAGCWKACSACRAGGGCRTFAGRSFLRRAKRRGWTRQPRSHRPRVAYFVDVFANYNDPLIAEAVVAVLHHNGIEVYVPPGQIGCGMAPLAYGDVETARETVQHNLRILGRPGPRGLSDPLLRADRGRDAAPRRPRPARRPRRAAGRRRRRSSSRRYLWDLHQPGPAAHRLSTARPSPSAIMCRAT